MKRFAIFFLSLSIVLTACGTAPAKTPTLTVQPATSQAAATATQTPPPAPTSTPLPPTPTASMTPIPSVTPSAPETCPQVNAKLRAQFGPAFRDKKAPYHDLRQIVLDFLNEGGDPKTAIAKLAENDIAASQLDLTNDGVPEFLLPSGYFTVFGCKSGRFETLLDVAPTGQAGYQPVPLTIQDLNLNGIVEIFFAQVMDNRDDQGVRYSLLEWNGATFSPITPLAYGNAQKVHIENHDIYAVGKSRAEKGQIEGNWETIDIDGDGRKEIIIKAGVDVKFLYAPDLEEQLILSSNGADYKVTSYTTELPPTPVPTYTALPFSPTCDYHVPDLINDSRWSGKGTEAFVESFLNAGGDPEKLRSMLGTLLIQDLNQDGLKDILFSNLGVIYLFSCVEGKYRQLTLPLDQKKFDLMLMRIQDINQNGIPDIIVKDDNYCFGLENPECGAIYVLEWAGSNGFRNLVKDEYEGSEFDYVATRYRQEVSLKDIDGDGTLELVWIGGKPLNENDVIGLPWRLETHVYQWDTQYYRPQPIEYSAPIYRFQAVQDGDHFALAGQGEKALAAYKDAIENERLGWWSDARRDYILGQSGQDPCAEQDKYCSPPSPDPAEKPILQAYSLYRVMLTQLTLGKPDQAKTSYDKLLSTYPDMPASSIAEMASAFWNEYQSSQSIDKACSKAIVYVQNHAAFLAYIGTDYHGAQSQIYKPANICPFH